MDKVNKNNFSPWSKHPLYTSEFNPEKTKQHSDIALVSTIASSGALLILSLAGKSWRWKLPTLALGGGSIYLLRDLWSKRFQQNEKICKAIQNDTHEVIMMNPPLSIMQTLETRPDFGAIGHSIFYSATPWPLPVEKSESNISFLDSLKSDYGSNCHLMLSGTCQRKTIEKILVGVTPTVNERAAMLKGLGYQLHQENILPSNVALQYSEQLNQKRYQRWTSLISAHPDIIQQLPLILRDKIDFKTLSLNELIARLKFEQTCEWLKAKSVQGTLAIAAAAMHLGSQTVVNSFKDHLKKELPEFVQSFWRTNLVVIQKEGSTIPMLQIEMVNYVPKNEGAWIADAPVHENHLPIKAVLNFNLNDLTNKLDDFMLKEDSVQIEISKGTHAIDLDPIVLAQQTIYDSTLQVNP